ncbi:hypothetical protein NC651_007917 [Populus alba x Populus x berolinensis]|nr:hypothetical protein NC651_007917 [Populus alba x Populus x berolinensis]
MRETVVGSASSASNVHEATNDNTNPYRNMVMDAMRMNEVYRAFGAPRYTGPKRRQSGPSDQLTDQANHSHPIISFEIQRRIEFSGTGVPCTRSHHSVTQSFSLFSPATPSLSSDLQFPAISSLRTTTEMLIHWFKAKLPRGFNRFRLLIWPVKGRDPRRLPKLFVDWGPDRSSGWTGQVKAKDRDHEQKKDNLRPLQASRCSPVPIRNRDSRSYATVLRQEFQRNLLDIEDKAGRGKETSIAQHECLKWLDSKKPNSVVYICFGSMAHFIASQLKEIATDLEASGHQFIWVVRRNKKSQ